MLNAKLDLSLCAHRELDMGAKAVIRMDGKKTRIVNLNNKVCIAKKPLMREAYPISQFPSSLEMWFCLNTL
jgi:hypothetical protein